MTILKQLTATKRASYDVALLSTQKKNAALKALAKALRKNTQVILRANQKDLAAVPADYSMTDRLRLSVQRIEHMAHSLEAVAKLADPIGDIISTNQRPTGLKLKKVRVPLGVLGVIYEARPNVTTEIFSLAFKTGNAVVLRGSRDAYYSNQALVGIIQAILDQYKLPQDLIYLVNPNDQAAGDALLRAHGLIDVLIPRGSNRLIQYVRDTATVPVIETGAGVCHTYVEASADLTVASRIVMNAKTRRVSVCNALDCIVVDKAISRKLFTTLAPQLAKTQVVLHADPASYAILKTLYPTTLLHKARKKDFGKEWLSLHLTIKTVAQFKEALSFIQEHTSGHSEAIITSTQKLADQFTQQIDAAAVYVNTSTAFTDGFEFGLGAEVGISTQKLHARGPMGLTELTTYKWVVTSAGAIRNA